MIYVLIFSLCIFCFSLLILYCSYKQIQNAEDIKILREDQQQQIDNKIAEKQNRLDNLNSSIDETQNRLHFQELLYTNEINDFKTNASIAMSSYAETLEQAYENAELSYSEKMEILSEEYSLAKNDLEGIKKTILAAREAYHRQQEEKVQTIELSVSDQFDIERMMEFSKTLTNSRVLRMAIWTSLIRNPLNSLCDKVFGNEEVCGIYKLTNEKTKEVYIGQSNRCKTRMTEHFKKGLGIDAPKTSKLYNNLQQYGVWNISIELLEKCEPEELDAKEKMYIDIYQANHSLNSTKGNN